MTRKQETQKKNHPKRGSRIRVDPITDLKDIRTLKKILRDRPADHALFVIGINTNLRASDLLGIRAGQVRGLNPGDHFGIKEKKTGKERRVLANRAVCEAVRLLLASGKFDDADHLFTGQRGVWSVSYVNAKVKSWCGMLNLKGNFGSHTLRKTWGYHQHKTFGVSLPVLMRCFNHSSQKQTLAYLSLPEEEVRSVFLNEL